MSRAPLVCAHRGDSAHCRENTLRAFRAAIAAGSDMIEMDVRLSSDHQPVVIHDTDLRRLYGKKERVSHLTYAEIHRRTGGDVPALEEVLEVFGGKVLFYIEVKAEHLKAATRELLVHKVWEAIKAAGAANDCLVASFDYRVAQQYRRLQPSGWTGFIFSRSRALRKAHKYGFKDVDVLCPAKKLLTARFVHSARNLGKQVIPWVLDEAREQSHAIALGVDAIVTNNPAPLAHRLASKN